MVTITTGGPRRLYRPTNVLRDLAFVLPGFALSLVAFVLLVPLTVLSVGTLIIWVGALLLPVTLLLASTAAALSRARLRRWGVDLAAPRYRSTGRGFSALLRTMTDPRRWFDLTFETVIAFPLHLFTFVIALIWTLGSLAGITHVFWGVFLPREDNTLPGLILDALTQGAAPQDLTHSYGLDAGFNLVIGIILLVTLPPVLRGLARLDAAAMTAALGQSRRAEALRSVSGERVRGELGAAAPPFRSPVSGAGWSWIIAIAVAVVSVAVSWPLLATLSGAPVAIAMVIAFGHAAALLLVVRFPRVGILVQMASIAASTMVAAGAAGAPWPWPVMTLILQTVLVLVVTLNQTGMRRLGTDQSGTAQAGVAQAWIWGGTAWLLPQLAALAASVPFGLDPGARTNMIVSASVTLGALVIGGVIAQLLASRAALQTERRTSANLSARSRELDERNRIAQELHDVVAHSMSVISVQATTAPYRLSEVTTESEREFQSIAESSRRALTEMRSLLTLLRSTDEHRDAPLAPQPSLNDLPALVESTRQSGTDVHLTVTPSIDPGHVSQATGLTGYRIIQEALSNAVRHSPGAAISVSVTTTAHSLTIDVTNGPIPDSSHPSAPGSGLGLAGIRERVDALHGTVEAEPSPDGGFRVRATLPLHVSD